ncbi:hypothetical protein PCANC_10100 [Puccinia coronata f. sp. avenae]|uniref:Uncharacterized protein n=1 Tax=Puccinia coronata f. sp. avenae TaxID=200324 RepID=A0A2N5V783_9BASI|nr:hypothetical protein PCANC_10100 [Puccinia coronata f. sp. avenae]
MTKAQIKTQPNNASQWAEIDERLRVLRGESKAFQQAHAQLVLDKDDELFSHSQFFKDIPKETFQVPSLLNV